VHNFSLMTMGYSRKQLSHDIRCLIFGKCLLFQNCLEKLPS
jgi:hypothetical protein